MNSNFQLPISNFQSPISNLKYYLNWIYRYYTYRGGFGVHSPFAFNLITKVIEEKTNYYCYDFLRAERLKQCDCGIKLRFSQKEDELFFRLANRFKPKKILVVGSDGGIIPKYLTAYSTSVKCKVLETSNEITDSEKFDLIFMNERSGMPSTTVFEKLLQCISGDDALMIISDIDTDKSFRQYVYNHQKVSVTIDLINIAVVFFNPKIHRQNYKASI